MSLWAGANVSKVDCFNGLDVPRKKDLLSCALSCKAVSEPALKALWHFRFTESPAWTNVQFPAQMMGTMSVKIAEFVEITFLILLNSRSLWVVAVNLLYSVSISTPESLVWITPVSQLRILPTYVSLSNVIGLSQL